MASVEFKSQPTTSEAPAAAPTQPVVAPIETPAVTPPASATVPETAPAKPSKGKTSKEAAKPTEVAAEPAGVPPIPDQPPAQPEPKYVIGKVTEEDMAKYTAEVTAKGELSEETLAELESKNIPRHMAVQHVQSLKAQQAQVKADVLSVVGGEESYQKIAAWASQKLSAEERSAFNEAAAQGNVPVLKTMLKGIKASYEAEMGSLGGGLFRGTPSAGEAPFASRAEMIAAFNNPKYKTDEAYRARVAARIPSGGIASFSS